MQPKIKERKRGGKAIPNSGQSTDGRGTHLLQTANGPRANQFHGCHCRCSRHHTESSRLHPQPQRWHLGGGRQKGMRDVNSRRLRPRTLRSAAHAAVEQRSESQSSFLTQQLGDTVTYPIRVRALPSRCSGRWTAMQLATQCPCFQILAPTTCLGSCSSRPQHTRNALARHLQPSLRLAMLPPPHRLHASTPRHTRIRCAPLCSRRQCCQASASVKSVR